MTSSFSGLTNALAALNVQRYGMEVTGQNIANANTPGYTRQRAELAAVGPATGVSALYATQHPNGSATVPAATAPAQLNGNIAVATASGTNTNALADQRDVLLLKLADLTGAQTTILADGTASVNVGGQSLVSSTTASTISLSPTNQILVGGTP